jgi:hypothetical protein
MMLLMPRFRRVCWMLVLACATVGGACAPRSAPGPAEHRSPVADETAVEPITSTDPCAMRLHELTGALLLYYSMNFTLPADLAELGDLADNIAQVQELVCPVSRRPYIYNPNGIFMAERKEYVIVYDAAPSHAGMRWAITIEEPVGGKSLVARVVTLPESFFLFRR